MLTNITRRTFFTGIAALAGLGLAGCGSEDAVGSSTGSGSGAAAGDLLAQIRERGEMVFATEGTWSPWTFHNEAG